MTTTTVEPDLSNTINANFIIDGNHIFFTVNPTNPSKSSRERINQQKFNFIEYYAIYYPCHTMNPFSCDGQSSFYDKIIIISYLI